MMYFVSVEEMRDILRYMFNMNISTSKISMRYAGNSWPMMYTGEELTERDIYESAINNKVAVQIKPTKVINSLQDYENIENATSEISGDINRLVSYVEFLEKTREERAKKMEEEERREREEREERERKIAQQKSDQRFHQIAMAFTFTILVFPWILIGLYAMFLYFTFYAPKLFKFCKFVLHALAVYFFQVLMDLFYVLFILFFLTPLFYFFDTPFSAYLSFAGGLIAFSSVYLIYKIKILNKFASEQKDKTIKEIYREYYPL